MAVDNLDIPFSWLLQIPDEEREFLNLEELKPQQLTDLSILKQPSSGVNDIILSQNSSGDPEASLTSNCSIYHDYQQQKSQQKLRLHTFQSQQSYPSPHTTLPQHHQQQGTSEIFYGLNSASATEDISDYEDDMGDSKSTQKDDDTKKKHHSEIEKKRRDKINTYITEMGALVPICKEISRKLDKLTVLRMTVQYLKSIRGAIHSYTEGCYKPDFLSEEELKSLILQAADGFLFVASCDRGRILYVSESVSEMLNYTQCDLLGQSWFDIVHPNDISNVKGQLSVSEIPNTITAVLTRLCPGARRSFLCRMKCKTVQLLKEDNNMLNDWHQCDKQLGTNTKYNVVQCTGYVTSCAMTRIDLEEQETNSNIDKYNLSCFVAVGRILPSVSSFEMNRPNFKSIEFISRHSIEGKFLFADQRAAIALGFVPQELLGTNMYEYYHDDDMSALAESHKEALQTNEKVTTCIYRFRTKNSEFIRMQTEWKSFKNPWTKCFEYLNAKNFVILNNTMHSNFNAINTSSEGVNGTYQNSANFDLNDQLNDSEMNRMIDTHIRASKISRQIVKQVTNNLQVDASSSDNNSDSEHCQPNASNLLPLSNYNENFQCRPVLSQQRVNGSISACSHISETNQNESNGTYKNATTFKSINGMVKPEGTDESTTMTDIMTLLEANAGLGDAVNIPDFPWS